MFNYQEEYDNIAQKIRIKELNHGMKVFPY